MLRFRPGAVLVAGAILLAVALTLVRSKAQERGQWSFAVAGDSRNCGDFVMPAIAAKVKTENDAFYWHLGDFRWMSKPDQDLVAMLPSDKPLSIDEYHR